MGCEIDWTILRGFAEIIFKFAGDAAWPTSAFGICFLFREAIRKAIGRAKSASAMGASVELAPAEQEKHMLTSDEVVSGATAQALSGKLPPPNEYLAPLEEHFRQVLDENGNISSEERESWLVRFASSFTDLWRQEQHYRLIFGSQIAFLNHLNLFGSQDFASVKSFFDLHGESPAPIPAYNFENWLGFMLSNRDIVLADGRYTLTPLGKRFLVWMKEAGVVEQKPF